MTARGDLDLHTLFELQQVVDAYDFHQ